ncbi:putative quinol monooxygenase [uncultured Tenacibaculum sp.]|uniref:putative quinol monooxygenase n=1 Tax=uncultured Tenacibaculum sp. TaxID=174713 RepID=UPI00260AA3C6|nr:putative quinol monooxygenase [uncultured Tenacibaculum sp.]
MKKIIIAQLSIKEAYKAQFLNLSEDMVTTSNSEEGCITYQLHNDVFDSNSFLFYEEYINEEAVNHHNNSIHFSSFINAITPLLTKAPIINMY